MAAYEGPIFDADNHFYEAHDAFTRHVPEEMQARCVQWITLERSGRQYQLVGGRLDAEGTNGNPTFDPISRPGVLRELFQGNPDGKTGMELIRSSLEPLRAEYMDRDARLAVMDEQGLDGAWLFPTQAVLLEEQIKHDVNAACVVVRRLQPVARRGLGLQLQGPHLRRPVHLARRCRLGLRAARQGPRTGRPTDRDAARARCSQRPARETRAIRSSTSSGPG